jgi:hypothetical protein
MQQVSFLEMEEPEVFTDAELPGAWTRGDSGIELPVSDGAVELTLAQPPPRDPVVHIETGAGITRVELSPEPRTVRVELGGRSEVRIRSETRAPASYTEGNEDRRRLGAILFRVRRVL